MAQGTLQTEFDRRVRQHTEPHGDPHEDAPEAAQPPADLDGAGSPHHAPSGSGSGQGGAPGWSSGDGGGGGAGGMMAWSDYERLSLPGSDDGSFGVFGALRCLPGWVADLADEDARPAALAALADEQRVLPDDLLNSPAWEQVPEGLAACLADGRPGVRLTAAALLLGLAPALADAPRALGELLPALLQHLAGARLAPGALEADLRGAAEAAGAAAGQEGAAGAAAAPCREPQVGAAAASVAAPAGQAGEEGASLQHQQQHQQQQDQGPLHGSPSLPGPHHAEQAAADRGALGLLAFCLFALHQLAASWHLLRPPMQQQVAEGVCALLARPFLEGSEQAVSSAQGGVNGGAAGGAATEAAAAPTVSAAEALALMEPEMLWWRRLCALATAHDCLLASRRSSGLDAALQGAPAASSDGIALLRQALKHE